MKRTITVVGDVASKAEADDLFYALHLVLEDRAKSDDPVGHLLARTLVGLRPAGSSVELSFDRVEDCSGLAATWCPWHGHCSCPDPATAMDDPSCPLHGPDSLHAEGNDR